MAVSTFIRSPRLIVGLLTATIVVVAVILVRGGFANDIELLVGSWQNAIASNLGPHSLAGPRLYGVAFIGGLAASLSPCILGMLPINLSFIGAAAAPSRRSMLIRASSFVAGVGIVNVALGLVSSLFFAVLVTYRSSINIGVGIVTIVMGLWMAGFIRLSVPQVFNRMPTAAGPLVVGIVFALVASPCASPVLVSVLGVASADGSLVRAAGAMVAYTIGYTAVLFFASLSTGLAVSSRRVLAYGDVITRVSAFALIALGIGTIAYGVSIR